MSDHHHHDRGDRDRSHHDSVEVVGYGIVEVLRLATLLVPDKRPTIRYDQQKHKNKIKKYPACLIAYRAYILSLISLPSPSLSPTSELLALPVFVSPSPSPDADVDSPPVDRCLSLREVEEDEARLTGMRRVVRALRHMDLQLPGNVVIVGCMDVVVDAALIPSQLLHNP